MLVYPTASRLIFNLLSGSGCGGQQGTPNVPFPPPTCTSSDWGMPPPNPSPRTFVHHALYHSYHNTFLNKTSCQGSFQATMSMLKTDTKHLAGAMCLHLKAKVYSRLVTSHVSGRHTSLHTTCACLCLGREYLKLRGGLLFSSQNKRNGTPRGPQRSQRFLFQVPAENISRGRLSCKDRNMLLADRINRTLSFSCTETKT